MYSSNVRFNTLLCTPVWHSSMPSIPIDVLREILEHVDKNDLATLCRVNKIVCSCSQDVLYREIGYGYIDAIETLAQSTDLARRVRSFQHYYYDFSELETALKNMSSLRSLGLCGMGDDHILDACTFKLDSFETNFPNSESLQKFLNSQPGITNLTIWGFYEPLPPFDERCLPNLTRINAEPSWLGILIPGRPVREVVVGYEEKDSFDFSIITLSDAPIRKLKIAYKMLYPTPGPHLASIFPSLEHLMIDATDMDWAVRIPPLYWSI
jgi:F-box domain